MIYSLVFTCFTFTFGNVPELEEFWSSRKYPLPSHLDDHWKFQGAGNLKHQIFLRERMKIHHIRDELEFQRGGWGGSQTSTLRGRGGIGIFWKSTFPFQLFCSYLAVSLKYSWQKSKQRVTAREITFNIVKKEEGPYWPRLFKQGKKVRLATQVSYPQDKKPVSGWMFPLDTTMSLIWNYFKAQLWQNFLSFSGL